MIDLDDRVKHLSDLNALIEHLIKSKDKIQNIVCAFDERLDGEHSTGTDFSYVGNFNACYGLARRAGLFFEKEI